jgi:hypothetical protein
MAHKSKKPVHFVTFFGTSSKDTRKLVGIGLTDAALEDLKKNGAWFQGAEKNEHDTDVLLLYAPSLNEVVGKIKDHVGRKPDEVKIL